MGSRDWFLDICWPRGTIIGWQIVLRSYWGHLGCWKLPAFLIIFVGVMLLAGMAGRVARRTMKEAGLSFVDRILGAALGLLRGCLIVAIVLMSMAAFTPTSRWLQGSELAPYFLVAGRAAVWVAPLELRTRFYQGLDLLRGKKSKKHRARRQIINLSSYRRGELSQRKRDAVRDQLEALVMQMYRSNILYSEAVREFKKRFILTVLQENKGNQCRAARQLGMHRNTLSRTVTD